MATKKQPRVSAKFTVLLSARGNPDYGQNAEQNLPGVATEKKGVDSLNAASEACLAYIAANNLGSGNWSGGAVVEGGVQVARISHNGRIWSMAGREIKL